MRQHAQHQQLNQPLPVIGKWFGIWGSNKLYLKSTYSPNRKLFGRCFRYILAARKKLYFFWGGMDGLHIIQRVDRQTAWEDRNEATPPGQPPPSYYVTCLFPNCLLINSRYLSSRNVFEEERGHKSWPVTIAFKCH